MMNISGSYSLFLAPRNSHNPPTTLRNHCGERKAHAITGNDDLTPEMYKYLIEVNTDLAKEQEELRHLYAQVEELYRNHVAPIEYENLLHRINETRAHISAIESSWRELATQNGNTEAYALWHQPETTIGQLSWTTDHKIMCICFPQKSPL